MDSTQYECMSFFFNDTATTEIYTLSLHDALPICFRCFAPFPRTGAQNRKRRVRLERVPPRCSRQYRCSSREFCEVRRSEEHTSELQSQSNLVCRLLLEKKKNTFHALMTNT